MSGLLTHGFESLSWVRHSAFARFVTINFHQFRVHHIAETNNTSLSPWHLRTNDFHVTLTTRRHCGVEQWDEFDSARWTVVWRSDIVLDRSTTDWPTGIRVKAMVCARQDLLLCVCGRCKPFPNSARRGDCWSCLRFGFPFTMPHFETGSKSFLPHKLWLIVGLW